MKEALNNYKQDFTAFQWKNEQYKWKAIQTFQDNWDVNATDFADMLSRSLAKTENLLEAANYFPKGMITRFAKRAPEEVRGMFIALFDESTDVIARIQAFKNNASVLLEKYGNRARQHYQAENAVSTYLWLRYPDKYYIYKYAEVKKVAEILGSDYRFKKGAYTANLRNFYRLYDEICAYIRTDTELTDLLRSQLTDSCYPDPAYKTLTVDVGFYISRFDSQRKPDADVSVVDVNELHSEAKFANWFVPLIETLLKLGGSGKRPEVHKLLLEEWTDVKEPGEDAARTKNNIDWARNYLVYEGFISNDVSGIWELTDIGKSVRMTRELAGKIVAKWVRIKAAERNKTPIPEIDLSQYYIYRDVENDGMCVQYAKEDFLREVFLSEQRYDMLTAVLKTKKNLILQGAPGVGKTFAAKRLAYSIMGEKDESRIEFVQFHQNYSYEDFVMGYKPYENGFKLETGIFYRFCQKAAGQPEKDFFFIIDEINRGNMSKIFGELLMLIENDYRGVEATLAYSGKPFSVPKNLYIIGMMNTADRSLAMIDYALRRRFSFFEMEPGFDSEGFVRYQNGLENETFNQLIERIKELNREIANDRSLGKGFCIGHSYFSNWSECTDEKMQTVVEFDVLPMLEEYWFDDTAKLQRWSNILHGVFQ
ncbi:MAG: AAA family ATPase [Clostridiales bacterium]|nr:AAA family ATPase [Clostridiales bacterium]